MNELNIAINFYSMMLQKLKFHKRVKKSLFVTKNEKSTSKNIFLFHFQ